jgi:hypothetical protein
VSATLPRTYHIAQVMTDSHNSGLTDMGRRMLSKAAIQLEPLSLSRRSAPWRVSLFGGYEEEMLERTLSSASPTSVRK